MKPVCLVFCELDQHCQEVRLSDSAYHSVGADNAVHFYAVCAILGRIYCGTSFP